MADIPTDMRTVTKVMHGYPKKHSLDIDWISNELWNKFRIKVAHSTLQRYLEPNDDLKLPADLVAPLCMICNHDFSVCDFIKKDTEKIKIKNKSVGILTKKAGKAITELAEAIEDDYINEDERTACIKKLTDLKGLVSKFLATLIEADETFQAASNKACL